MRYRLRALFPASALFTALFAALIALAAPVTASPLLDQRFDPRDPSPGGSLLGVMYRGGYFSQTFRAGVSGKLTGVDVLLSRQEIMQADVLFDLQPTLDGVPAPTLAPPTLARIPSAAIPVDPVGQAGPNADWVHVDLSPFDIVAAEGDVLAIVLKLDVATPVPPDPSRGFEMIWHGKTYDPYPGGQSFVHPPIPGSIWNPMIVEGITCDLGFRTWIDPVRNVSIVVRPGDDESSALNLRSRGDLAVAILGEPTFDAAQIDVPSLRVAGELPRMLPWKRYLARLEDVNADGLEDLVTHVRLLDLEVVGPEVEIIVTGSTLAGQEFRGAAWIRVVP